MNISMSPLSSSVRHLARDEAGVISVFSLFLFITICVIAAVAIDVTYFYTARIQLQTVADSAAHAALYNRNKGDSSEEAKLAAAELVLATMSAGDFGVVLSDEDIVFGTYDEEKDVFHADPESKQSVLVVTRREQSSGNPVPTFFFRMVGMTQVDISASAIFSIFEPGCLSQGFSADGRIDIQSGGKFLDGFCMHSNSHVKIGQNNYFETGAVISMPDLARLAIPSSGLASNEGLEEALREDFYRLKLVDRLRADAVDPLDAALKTPNHPDRPSYIEAGSPVLDLGAGGNTDYNSAGAFTQGRVHTRTCQNSNNTLTISGPSTGLTLSNFVLITNCMIELSGKVTLENVVLYSTNLSATSVQVSTGGGGGSTAGLWIGRPDRCAPGNAAQIFTRGGFKNSAALYMYGAHLVTLGPVVFASNATGEGATVTTTSTISGNSNLLFTACPARQPENFIIPYFQLAR